MMVASAAIGDWLTADEAAQAGTGATRLGQTMTTADGEIYVCVVLGTGGVTGDGYVCTIDEDFEAVMLTTSNDADGDQLGVAEGAGAAGDYGWLQVYGPAGVRTEQDALANAFLGATSDAGQLDDAAATGLYVDGIVLRTATGGADAVNATGFLNWPRIATRMEPEA